MRDWLIQALKESHQEETPYHQETTQRLEDTRRRLSSRLDQVYLDKLEGKVTERFWLEKSREWEAERDRVLDTLRANDGASHRYHGDSVRLLELASRAMNSIGSSRQSKRTNSYESCFRTAHFKAEVCILPTKNRSISWPEGLKEGYGVSDGFRTRDLRIHNPAL